MGKIKITKITPLINLPQMEKISELKEKTLKNMLQNNIFLIKNAPGRPFSTGTSRRSQAFCIKSLLSNTIIYLLRAISVSKRVLQKKLSKVTGREANISCIYILQFNKYTCKVYHDIQY